MKRIIILCMTALLGTVIHSYSQPGGNAPEIIPYPNSVTTLSGEVILGQKTTIAAAKDFRQEAEFLKKYLKEDFGIDAVIESGKTAADIYLKKTDLNEKHCPVSRASETYELNADKGIILTAHSPAGIFYGLQTLRQLIRPYGEKFSVQKIRIKDNPAFSWRAFMLDEGRYFKGMDAVKALLDEMALLKMNVFHWHLTDDQGWRIEIKKYPLLTKIGSYRDSSQIGGWNSPRFDGKPHAGFYTQKEIKEIVDYAARRHITIVPEIEMPGHACAAVAAYPWLGSSPEQIGVAKQFGVQGAAYNVADERVYRFLQNVLDEVMALFPGQIIHIGGDEVKYDQWKNNDAVKALMKKENMETLSDVQVFFTNRISNYIEKKGRRMMGWNEIYGSNVHEWSKEGSASLPLAKSAVIHFWKGDPKLMTKALEEGYEVVNSLHSFTYIDYSYQSIPLSKAYGFNPLPEGIDTDKKTQILGSGCQMWGEWIPSVESMQRMVFPRLAAYAESGWTEQSNKDFNRFKNTLPFFEKRWKNKGYSIGETNRY